MKGKNAFRLRLDYSNMMAENIGSEHGIDRNQIQKIADSIDPIHQEFLHHRQSNEVSFWNLPSQKKMAEEVLNYVRKVRGKFDHYVHIGIGGSALGAIALHTALQHPLYNLSPQRRQQRLPQVFFLDNIDPDTIKAVLNVIDIDKTLFNVVTKSGSTAETLATFLVFLQYLKDRLGSNYHNHLVFVTDPAKGFLRQLASTEGITAFAIPPGVGGRFSVLTPVGLLPAAIAGIDILELLHGASFMDELCQQESIWKNPAYLFAVLNYLNYQRNKKIVVMMPYSDRLYRLADWFRQLWAESLGKKLDLQGRQVFVGPTPVKALGTTDQHSQVQLYVEGPFDKIFVFLEVEQFETVLPINSGQAREKATRYLEGHTINELIAVEKRATELALTRNQRPNCTIKFPLVSAFTIGQIFQMLEIATAFAGKLFEINPFDQPGVEEGKIVTYALMGREGYEDKRLEVMDELQKRVVYEV